MYSAGFVEVCWRSSTFSRRKPKGDGLTVPDAETPAEPAAEQAPAPSKPTGPLYGAARRRVANLAKKQAEEMLLALDNPLDERHECTEAARAHSSSTWAASSGFPMPRQTYAGGSASPTAEESPTA